jgi:fibronectin-binding autotransporter adhesin
LTIAGHFGVGGQTTAGASFYTMTGGTLDITGTSGNTAYVGGANDLGVTPGEGHFIMSGGSVANLAAGSYMVVGDNIGSVGTIELSGSAQLNACQLYTAVRGGVASITVGGNAVLTTTPAFDTITLGYPGPGGGLGVLNVAGGTVHVKNFAPYHTSLVVGDASAGVLNAGNGLLNGDDGVIEIRGLGIANIGTAGGTGQVTVQIGGFAPYIFDHANRGIINFHGGIIMPTVSSGTFLQELAAATVYSEGAVFDTDGHDITVAQNLVKPDGMGVVTLDIPLANRGAGYKVAPVVALTTASGDTGYGATAVAEMESDGAGGLRVAKIVITNPGTNYLAAPTVTLYGGGAAATADLSALSLSLADNVSGGLTKNGLGSLTLTGALTYSGDTTVNVGTLNATTGIDTPNAAVYVATGATLNASSIVADTLTIGGAPNVAANAVPEPGTLVLLVLFGMGALLAWRRK